MKCWGGGGIRQADSQAEKGFCFSCVTEALGVCCPTFGMPVHVNDAQVAGIATAGVERQEGVEEVVA